MQLQLTCGAGPRCVKTSRPVPASAFIVLVVVIAVVVAAVPTGAVLHARRLRAQARLRDAVSERRAVTVQLLQNFVADEDVDSVILPPDSVDFGVRSVCVASGGGGAVYVVVACPRCCCCCHWCFAMMLLCL